MSEVLTKLFFLNIFFNDTVELVITLLIFIPIYPLKSHFKPKALVITLCSIVIMCFANLFWGVPASLLRATMTYPVALVVGPLVVKLCAKVDYKKALFCVLCAITAHQVTAAIQLISRVVLMKAGIPADIVFTSFFINFLQMLVTLYILYHLIVKQIAKYSYYILYKQNSMFITFIVLPVVIALGVASIVFSSRYNNDIMFACFQMLVLVNCIYILCMIIYECKNVAALNEVLEKEAIIEKQKEQFTQSKKNIEEINKKCHDLKHHIAAIKQMSSDSAKDNYIKEMEENLQKYNAFIRSGNETLDVVLTEKNLFCKQNQISLACVVDGDFLEFMDIIDMYTILGNALDNAIECVMKIQDVNKRYISLKAFPHHQFLNIQIENYCEEFPKLVDGIPLTSKEDISNHGYGIKSIKMCVEKYNGNMIINNRDRMFCLQILIPLTKQVTKNAE